MGNTPKPPAGDDSPAPLLERPLGSVASPSLIKEGDRGSSLPVIPVKTGIHGSNLHLRLRAFSFAHPLRLLESAVRRRHLNLSARQELSDSHYLDTLIVLLPEF